MFSADVIEALSVLATLAGAFVTGGVLGGSRVFRAALREAVREAVRDEVEPLRRDVQELREIAHSH